MRRHTTRRFGHRSRLAVETLETRCLLTRLALDPIVPAEVVDGDQFGASVAMDAETLLVGAPGSDAAAGAAYVFEQLGETWVEKARLTASEAQANDTFGDAVSVDGDLLVIGSPQLDTDRSGAIYVFARTGGTWSEQARLVPSDTTGIRQFGESVSIDGNVIVVGAETVPDDRGATFVFRYDGRRWNEEARLNVDIPDPPIPEVRTFLRGFGASVGVHGDTIVVGAPRFANSRFTVGAIFVFEYDQGAWNATAGFADGQGAFGSSVAIDQDSIVAIASNSATFYDKTGGGWVRQATIRVPTEISYGSKTPRPGKVAVDGDLAVAAGTELKRIDSVWQPVATVPVNPEGIDGVAVAGGQVVVGHKDRSPGGQAFSVGEETSIGGRVWDDVNRDGHYDPTENPVAYVGIALLDADGNWVRGAVTDAQGLYNFHLGLTDGTYIVRVVAPPGTQFSPMDQGGDDADSDVDPVSGRTVPIALARHQRVVVDAGLFGTASFSRIAGSTWIDTNKDGVRDNDELPLVDVKVTLIDQTNHLVAATTRTASDGSYAFLNVAPASYTLQYETQTGFGRTTDFGDTFPIIQGQDVSSRDVGFVFHGETIHGFVWDDGVPDGVRQANESGIAGVTVRLLDDRSDVVFTTATGANGLYQFPSPFPRIGDPFNSKIDAPLLASGTLRVEVVAPPNTAFSPRGVGSGERTGSDVDPVTGLSDSFLLDNQSSQPVRNDAGLHGTSPATRIEGVAWDDANGDGIRDRDEATRAGIEVQLLDAHQSVVATTVTGTEGTYQFAGIAPGSYTVAFLLPADSHVSPLDRGGDDSIDSDVNRSTGRTALLPLLANEQVSSIDVGIYNLAFSQDVQAALRITEIDAGNEFVELKNIGPDPIDLRGVRLIDGIVFDFASADFNTLFPGERLVVAGDVQKFAEQYDTSAINLAGEYTGTLDDQGESIELVTSDNTTILNFGYDTRWFRITEGPFSLTIIDDLVSTDLWSHRAAWRPSSRQGGSPGRDDPGLTPDPGAVVINEIITRGVDSHNDAIELLNTTDHAIDIGGWFLGDQPSKVGRYRIADGTIIPAGGLLTFAASETFRNGDDPGSREPFGLSSFGEAVFLTAGDRLGNFLGYSESVRFAGSDVNVSFGRQVVENRSQYRASVHAIDRPERFHDMQTGRFTFEVDHVPGRILDLDVPLSLIPHGGAISVQLISPSGTVVSLVDSAARNIDVVFDDEGTDPRPIGNGLLPHLPPVGDLSDFDGEDPRGVWTLEITSVDGTRVGTLLEQWSLEMVLGLPASDLVALETPTLGSANAIPRADPVVINEIMYRPAFLGDEFLELHNVTVDLVDVGGWQVDGIGDASGGDFVIPAGTTIPADGYLLIVPTEADAFRQKHAIDGGVPIVGPYAGSLDDAGETIRLFKFGDEKRKILVDQVAYENRAPWPVEASQGGGSLERVLPTRYGNDASNWRVTSILGGTPGAANTVTSRVVGDLNLDGTVDADDIGALIEALEDPRAYSVQYRVQPAWTGDTDGDGDFDFDDFLGFVQLIGGSVDASARQAASDRSPDSRGV